jgi:YfiH family protein
MTSFKQTDNGVFVVDPLPAGLRIGVIAKRANSIDYGMNSGDIRECEKVLIQGITGDERLKITMLNQMHGDDIIQIDSPPSADLRFAGDADGFTTSIGRVCLVIRSADCVPVFAYDGAGKILGAVHSGWRGTRLSVVRKLVRDMREQYGSNNSDMRIFILPSIGPRSYVVGRDVAGLFPLDVTEREGSLYLNLWQCIERDLKEEGIPGGNIFNSGVCTLENNKEFFSHRGGDAGRNVNYGYLIP